MRSRTLKCPADGGGVPAIEGAEAVDGEWRLSVAAHEDLLREITGVNPREELDLQSLATITARLEGYVERKRRETPPSVSTGDAASDETATESGGTDLLTRLRRWLSSVWSLTGSRSRDSDPDRQPSLGTYDVERVYELSRFFRSALAARRAALEVEQPTGTTATAAD
jgi:hypothetical protein